MANPIPRLTIKVDPSAVVKVTRRKGNTSPNIWLEVNKDTVVTQEMYAPVPPPPVPDAPPAPPAPPVDATWSQPIPDIHFAQGAADSRSVLHATSGFNPTLHEMRIAETSAALPTGVTLTPTGSLVYDGAGPSATVSGIVLDIEDKAAVYAQLVEDDAISWLNASGGLYMTWLNAGGDWRDSANAQNGSTSYATANISAFGAQNVTFNVTALATRLLTNNTGVHVRLTTSTGVVNISSRTGAQAPTLQIVTNTGTFNCPCTISFWIDPSSNQTLLGADIKPTALLKFDVSAVTGTVTSATMTLGVTNVFAGAFPRTLAVNYLDMPRLYYAPAIEVGGVVQGIANSVAQDNLLGSHPSVLCYDDLTSDDKFYGASRRFVTVNLGQPTGQGAAGHYYEALPQYGLTALVMKSGTSGPQIMDVHRWSQPLSAEPEAGSAWHRPYTVDQELGHTHLFFRYLMWIGEDVYAGFNELGMKLPGLTGSYEWSSSGAPTLPAPAYRCIYRGEHSKDSTAAPGFYTFYTYEYDADWPLEIHSGVGRTPANMSNVVRGAALRAGRWYCLEQEIQLNTLNGLGIHDPNGLGIANVNPDGIERWWIDGVLVYEYTNMRSRGSKAANIQSIPLLTLYHGGNTPPRAPFTYKMAGVCVASKYIGPPKVLA